MMRFSMLVAGASAHELFQPATPTFHASPSVETYPAIYEASPMAGGPAVVPVPVTYVEESSSTDSYTPVFVVALAVAGYVAGRAYSQPASLQEVDPATDLANAEAGQRLAMLGLMGSDKPQSAQRREVLAKAGAALASLAAVQSASAKAGQFGKQEIFSIVGTPGISSPYQPGGPKAGKDSTFGYSKSEGDFLANGYENDVSRELAQLKTSTSIVKAQGPNIESKTWWLVRDNLRGQAYNMKANMLAINKVISDPDKKSAASKSYAKFWKEVDSLDYACQKKELSLAQKEYGDVLAALKAYEDLVSL